MSLVSIIVPFYNAEESLERCINSILHQRFQDFELILVNDGSTDNSLMICESFHDIRIKIITNIINSGVSTARNTGIENANSKYITFCDADDYLLPNHLYNLVYGMEDNDVQLVSGGYETEINGECIVNRIVNENLFIDIASNRIDYLEKYKNWSVCTKLFILDIIKEENIEFCTTCQNFAEDWCFVLEYLLYCKKMMMITDCDYRYISRNDSMMSQSKDVIKLNELNEVSIQFGKRFFGLYPNNNDSFSQIFYVLIHNQSIKYLSSNYPINKIRESRKTIMNIVWFDEWLNYIKRSIVVNGLLRKELFKYFEINYLLGKKYYLVFIRLLSFIIN